MRGMIRTAHLPGGISLPYVERGRADGVPVVFLHGVTDSHRSFDPLLPLLPDDVRAIAVTQRGHGEASRPEGGYDVEDLAGDVRALLDVLDVPSAVLVGHSMGSAVAQSFAAQHPQRVRGLMLIGAFHSMAGNPAVLEFCDAVSQLSDPVDREFVREFQAGTSARPLDAAFLEMVVEESLKLPAGVWRALFDGFREHRAGALERITAPTVILFGESETICTSADQERLAQRIAGSRLVRIPDVGHSVHWEVPELVCRELLTLAATRSAQAA